MKFVGRRLGLPNPSLNTGKFIENLPNLAIWQSKNGISKRFLIDSTDTSDPESIKELIHDVVDRLFKDAGVKYERVSKRDEHYSIADETYNEFSGWYDYSWD